MKRSNAKCPKPLISTPYKPSGMAKTLPADYVFPSCVTWWAVRFCPNGTAWKSGLYRERLGQHVRSGRRAVASSLCRVCWDFMRDFLKAPTEAAPTEAPIESTYYSNYSTPSKLHSHTVTIKNTFCHGGITLQAGMMGAWLGVVMVLCYFSMG